MRNIKLMRQDKAHKMLLPGWLKLNSKSSDSRRRIWISLLLFLPGISEPGRIRANTNASYYIKLFSDLSWNFSFYGNWDNQPPPTLSGSDYGTSSGLSWTFGNR